ncbi:MAG: sensor histidine kinase [Myxococcales bacterium]|jgi:GAF domain-containing protein
MLVWDWQELVARVYTPFPSAGVLGFLALPVCLAVGFGLLRGEPDGAVNVRLLLVDAGFFAFLMVLFNVVLLSGVLQSFTGTPLALASGLAYPVFHSSALALGIVVAGRARGRERTSLLLVVLSLAVLTGTVTVYAFSLLSRTYQVGAFLDVFWFAALLLLIGAAIEADALALHPAEPPAAQDERALVIEALLPAAALAIVALGAIMFSEQLGPALTWLLLSATIGVSVFYGLRLWQTRLAERASAEERARLLREAVSARTVAEAGQRREAFLADSSRRLGASLVLEETLPSVAGMAVPVLADWCAIAVLEVGRPPQVVCAHRDRGEQERIAEALADRLFFSPQAAGNLEKALLSGETQFVAAPEGAAGDELVARLAAQEVAFVPLRAHGATVGLLVLGLERGERRFDIDARTLAEMLGRRCALAIENARLFRRAQEAIAFRDEFLVVVSHELRTPLTTLLLQLGRLLELDTAPSERQRRLLESGIAQVRRLGVLSERLVDTASIADGRFELHREPCDLARIATQVVAEFQEQAQRAGCELKLEASEARGEWDAERLSQVIRNLLSNALRYGAGHSI